MPRPSKSSRRSSPRKRAAQSLRRRTVAQRPAHRRPSPSAAAAPAKPAPPPAPVFDTSAVVDCPYCGESVEITLDPSSGRSQRYVEDCAVCCRPWQVTLTYDDDGHADVFLATTDD
jgi:hypothetical protein